MPDNTPFFIIGAGRSGTTLLRLILAGHSRLHIPPETWFIIPLVRELPLTDVLTPRQVERATSIMTGDYRWPDMAIGASDLRCWAMALRNPRLVDIVNLVYRHQLENAGKQRFGDKTPVYYQIVPQLATLYPGAKFIHLIRDGRDVAISCIDVGWDRYYERSRFEWAQAMEHRRKYRHSPFADQILEVKYEDLVIDPAATLRRICTYLGEEFEPAMLDSQRRLDLIPPRERHIHRRLERPISRDAVAVWRTRLRAVECFAIEACLYRDLMLAGYGLRYANAIWRPFLWTIGGLLHGLAPVLGRGMRYLQRRGYVPKSVYF